MEDHEPEARIRGWMTLTKILVPTCRYCLNCTKFGKLILRKIIKIVATMQMSDFKAKMHQIRFRLGLRPRSRWGSLQRSPRPPSWIWGALLLRRGERRGGDGGEEEREGGGEEGGEEREGKRGEGKGGEGKGGEGREREGKGHEPPPHYLDEVYAYGTSP